AITSPALTMSPSRTRISRMRPETFAAMVESSPSMRPLSTMMLCGTGGWRIRNHHSRNPPAITIARITRILESFRRAICLVGSASLSNRDGHVVRGQRVAGHALQLGDRFIHVSLRAQLVATRSRQRRLSLEHEKHSRLSRVEFSFLAFVLLLSRRACYRRRAQTRLRSRQRLQSVAHFNLNQ